LINIKTLLRLVQTPFHLFILIISSSLYFIVTIFRQFLIFNKPLHDLKVMLQEYLMIISKIKVNFSVINFSFLHFSGYSSSPISTTLNYV